MPYVLACDMGGCGRPRALDWLPDTVVYGVFSGLTVVTVAAFIAFLILPRGTTWSRRAGALLALSFGAAVLGTAVRGMTL